MKEISKICLAILLLCSTEDNVFAQQRPAARRVTTPRRTNTNARQNNRQNSTRILDTARTNVAPVTTQNAVLAPSIPKRDPFAFDSIKPSLRPDDLNEVALNKERKPLTYEYTSLDDKWYKEVVWREIDIKEKMNLPFRYAGESEDGSSQRFINILLHAIHDSSVTAFSSVDDRFTTPLTIAQVGSMLSGDTPDTIYRPSLTRDPSGTLGLMDTVTIYKDINLDSDIVKFRIKEEWIFDKETSRMITRIKGVGPIKRFVDEATQEVKGEKVLFWIYYPDLRPTLALHEVYNGKNFGSKMTWEELFESRYFASYIVKSTIDNPYNKSLKEIFEKYSNSNILMLMEGDNIKNKIFNFEQGLWHY